MRDAGSVSQNKAEVRRIAENLPCNRGTSGKLTFRQFLIPDTFGRPARTYGAWSRRKEQIIRRHVAHQKRLFELHAFGDLIAVPPVRALRLGDIIDFRNRPSRIKVPRTANKTMVALSAALQEGFYRKELPSNPALEIGELGYEEYECGTFLPVGQDKWPVLW